MAELVQAATGGSSILGGCPELAVPFRGSKKKDFGVLGLC